MLTLLSALLSFVVLLPFAAFVISQMRLNKHAKHYSLRSSSPPLLHLRRKPEWVRKELIRLKAHLPDFACRSLADMFNRLYAARGVSVGKTFVADLLRTHAYEIAALRKTWKNRIPAPLPCNHTWGLDPTSKTSDDSNMHPILGIFDHGSRLAVCLLPLRDLTTITILRALLDTIERFGKPRRLRTDNACQFHSTLFRVTL